MPIVEVHIVGREENVVGASEESSSSPYDFTEDQRHRLGDLSALNLLLDGSMTRFTVIWSGSFDPLADPCRRLESIVFSETYGDHRGLLAAEYVAHEDQSTFLSVVDRQESRLSGCIRLLSGMRPGDLITIRDVMGHDATEDAVRAHHKGFDVERCWDLRLLAVAPEYRKRTLGSTPYTSVGMMLYRAVYALARSRGIDHWVTIADQRAHRILQGLGAPIEPLCGQQARPYQGSARAYPSYIHVPSISPVMEQKAPYAKRAMCDGEGFAGICDFPDI
jgi:GNAT superfamily N-acetyltransferase